MEVQNLKAGEYTVIWSDPDHETLSAEITVSSTGVTCVKVTGGLCESTVPPGVNITGMWGVFGTLKPVVVAKGYLSVSSTPLGASIDVNGTDIGKTPVTRHELSTGSKLVTLRLSGYKPEELTATIVADETASLSAALTPLTPEEEGFLSVTSVPSGASVSIGGVSIGATPLTSYGLPAGAKIVSISLSGYETETREVTVTAGETNTIEVTLSEAVVPEDVCGWIDSVGVGSLTRNHWLYVYYITKGDVAEDVIENLFNRLDPKPSSHIAQEQATESNWLGLYWYSIGSLGSGNQQTGCSF